MKNYTFGWKLREQGWVEISEENYSDNQKNMKKYVNLLSEAVCKARCGWDGVRYAAMRHDDCIEEYMVLWVEGGGNRWIPITGNSKGCNFTVLGENLW